MTIDDEILELRRVANIDIINSAIARAANEYESTIVSESIEANRAGKTFAGNDIDSINSFTDWYQTGEFHRNLRFIDERNIEFMSSGKGFMAIRSAYDRKDYIAPDKKTLSENTLLNVGKLTLENLFEKL